MARKTSLLAILSGGIDSAVAMALAIEDPSLKVPLAVTFNYGQRHVKELEAARALCAHYKVPYKLVTIPERIFSASTSSLLLGSCDEVPVNRAMADIAEGGVPNTFVPGRNMIFISIASAIAYNNGLNGVVGGWHWDDSSGYPDCRPEFLFSMEKTVQLAMDWNRFILHMPLIEMQKRYIVDHGKRLKVPFHLTWSCYRGDEKACGVCDTCQLRLKGFADAGVVDPLEYDAKPAFLRS